MFLWTEQRNSFPYQLAIKRSNQGSWNTEQMTLSSKLYEGKLLRNPFCWAADSDEKHFSSLSNLAAMFMCLDIIFVFQSWIVAERRDLWPTVVVLCLGYYNSLKCSAQPSYVRLNSSSSSSHYLPVIFQNWGNFGGIFFFLFSVKRRSRSDVGHEDMMTMMIMMTIGENKNHPLFSSNAWLVKNNT